MTTAVGRFLVAIVLFIAAAACWTEARIARRVADAHARLATLDYDVEDEVDEAMTPINRLPWPLGSLRDDVARRRARAGYWQSREQGEVANGASVAPLPGLAGANESADDSGKDPELMLVATNSAFRTVLREGGEGQAAVERLDAIIAAYREVLRTDPGNVDAAYNFEFVVRYRDYVARARPARGRQPVKGPAPVPVQSTGDLPAGPTIHGTPGQPPPDLPGGQFKTIIPQQREERDDPTQGLRPGRRG
jgi:hypothetical protein